MATGFTKDQQTGLECGKWVTPHNQSDKEKQTFLEDLKRWFLIVRMAVIVRDLVMSKGKQTGLEDGKEVAPHS